MIRFNPISPRFARGLPLILVAGLLAACMGPTPYQPRLEGQDTGYTDRALTQNRYRVTFTGNSVTPRETVESYLLLRAAEVARAAGYANFMFDTRNTNANHSYQTIPYGPDPFWGPGFGWGRRGYWGYWALSREGIYFADRRDDGARPEISFLSFASERVHRLLALDIDATSFLPADESGHGFDNVIVGDLSPTLLDRYISAAQKISRLLRMPIRRPLPLAFWTYRSPSNSCRPLSRRA